MRGEGEWKKRRRGNRRKMGGRETHRKEKQKGKRRRRGRRELRERVGDKRKQRMGDEGGKSGRERC